MNDSGAPRYWKSLDELADDEAFAARIKDEFPDAVDQTTSDPLSRRNFFRLMGASMALAGVAGPGCQRYEKEEIVPLSRRPEDQVPGQTLQYASVFELGGVGLPVVVTSYEGRPLHVDGNPQHPFSGDGLTEDITLHRHAGTSTFAQASVLNIYDQDRSRSPLNKGKGATFTEFKNWLASARDALKTSAGQVRVLSEALSSPTLAQMRRTLEGQGIKWVEWEPLSYDNERAGLKMAYGKPLRAFAHLDKCATIVSLDGDLFLEHPAGLRYAKDWKRSRGPEDSSLGKGRMNRVYAVESTFTSIGSVADHRLPLRSELILPFALALDGKLGGGGAPSSAFLGEPKVDKYLSILVAELKQNAGRAVVVAGRRQPPAVHALVARINEAINAPVEYLDLGEDRPTHVEGIKQLVSDINSGAVKTLFILGGNPVYDAPADLELGAALGKVDVSVHLSEWEDETSEKCTWHVPRANYLETWGDARAWDGTWTIAQPLIQPLYGGISPLELVAMAFDKESTGDKLIADAIKASGIDAAWRKVVHDGFVPGTAFPSVKQPLNPMPVVQLGGGQLLGSRPSIKKNEPIEVTWHFSSNTWDGRFANNAWLQETPDFFTKVVWDNYALVAPATAQDLGLASESTIKISIDKRELTLACYVMPGQAMGSIALVVGGGRTRAGSKGGSDKAPTVGFDTYKLRTSANLDIVSGATVSATGDDYKFSGTQEHWDVRGGIDKDVGAKGIAERLPELVVQVEKKGYDEGEGGHEWDARPEDEFWNHDRWVDKDGHEVKDPTEEQLEDEKLGLVKRRGRGHSLFQEHVYEGHRWAMSIDLGTCIGCNACMVACQSENNIPVVGKDQVVRNREMHWIRIDRYFEGSPDDPRIVNQPVGCQQCENAPCEQVCPVGATMHSSEGLNDMVYNRCVGTRYCLNNCPYRVRRFNFLDWNKEFKEARNRVRKLVMNPEVTVRHRGVMEKCTYCVQRIQNKKIRAKNERRDLLDGEITTACQDACPTQAITFGDLSNPDAFVTKLQNDRRSYQLLANLNTKPRTQYLARVRNPNPDFER